MINTYNLVFLGLVATCFCQNPDILEDARVHPSTDGSFGFLYRTQDGIAHAAKGVPGGAVQGRFTYTDPTGLKVNYNYNAGAQAVKAQQQKTQEPARPSYIQDSQPNYSQNQYQQTYEQSYEQPRAQPRYTQYQQPKYERPRYQPPKYPPKPISRYVQPAYQPQEQVYQPQESYEQPRYETAPRRETYAAPRQDSYSRNYVNDDYEQSYYQQ